MANFTPEELENFKEWLESSKGPGMSSVDDVLEAQREAQGAAELATRASKGADKPLSKFGELIKDVQGIKVKPSLTKKQQVEEYIKNISKTAEKSAKVFEEAGSEFPKNVAEDIVRSQSVPGKSAELSADVLAPKELPTVSNYATPREKKLFEALLKQAQSEMGVAGETVAEAVDQNAPKNLPATIKRGVPAVPAAPAVTDDFIETTGRTIDSVPEPSRLSKLSKFLPVLGKGATALGAAGSAYDFSKGNLVEGGLTGLETLLGNVSPRVAAPLELLRPTATVSQEEEQAELDRLKRSNILASLQKRGLAEESIGNDTQLASKKPPQFDYNVPERPTPLLQSNNTETSIPEIKSVKEQKSSPVSKSSVSTGVGEDDSPEAKLNEAIKAESEKPQKSEMDFNELLRMAQEARDKGVLLGNIGKAAETFATGLTGTVKGGIVTKPVGTDFYDKLIKQAEQPVEDVGTAYTMKTKQDEMDRLARRRDPGSEESKFARDLLAQQGIKVPEKTTAELLEKYAPWITNLYNQKENREFRALQANLSRENRLAKTEEALSEKEQKLLSEEKQKLEKRTSEQSQALLAVEDLESNIRSKYLKDPNFSLDTFDINKYKGDLPGANIPGMGRTSFYSSQGRQMQSDFDTVLNQMIRSFAGKAVTKNELERIRTQFASGDFNNEAEMLNAMAKAKRLFRQGMKSSEAAFSKKAVEQYKEAGGVTSDYGLQRSFEKEKDPEIQEYADKHSISYDQAQNILKARGYGK